MINGIKFKLNTDFFAGRGYFKFLADSVVYTVPIDQYFNYRFDALAYRSLHFDHEHTDIPNFQGNAIINYTASDLPCTRFIEHKHFEFGTQPTTIITKEYPNEWKPGVEQ